ncbi:MAG: ATP-binding protein [Bacillota bacterium]|nr:ATP-binding protein [Bacillota bacterium]
MNTDIHIQIKTEYERRKKAAHDKLISREQEVYAKIPQIEELELEIKRTGIRYNKMILLGTAPSGETVDMLVSRLDELKREKERLLVESGYPADYLEQAYQCQRCNDTGFVENNNTVEKCVCYKQQLLNYLFTQSNLEMTRVENYLSFNEDFYPEAVNEEKYGIRVSPLENIRYIKQKCFEFLENFSSIEQRNLFFCGPTGTGKTFMINCIANELLNKGVTVLYQTATSLFDVINNHRVKSYKEEGYDDSEYDYISKVELLIIDDLGTESPSGARYAELLNILDNRQANNLSRPCKTIISTNINMKKLYEYYDERVVSRIVGCFDIYRFAGEDIRSLKKFNRKAL